jgi:hypothetical protein
MPTSAAERHGARAERLKLNVDRYHGVTEPVATRLLKRFFDARSQQRGRGQPAGTYANPWPEVRTAPEAMDGGSVWWWHGLGPRVWPRIRRIIPAIHRCMECITRRWTSQDKRDYDGNYDLAGSGHMCMPSWDGFAMFIDGLRYHLPLLCRDQWVKPSPPMRGIKGLGYE